MSGLINPTKKDLTMFAPLPLNPDPNKAPLTPGVPVASADRQSQLLNLLLSNSGISNEQGNELFRQLNDINATKKQ